MDLLLLIGALLAAVWCAVVFVRGGLLAGALSVLLAGSCFGHPFFNLPGGPVPITSDRVLWALLLVQYVVWRRWGQTVAVPLRWSDVAVASRLGVLLAGSRR